MTRLPRLVFVLNSIGTGGAERALDTILRASAGRAERYDIHLVLLDDEPDRRTLPALATRHCLDARGRLSTTIIRLDRLLRQLKPDLVVSLLVRANIAAAIVGPRHAGSTMLCERMHLSSHLAGRYAGLALRVLRRLPRLVYRRADKVLAVSEGVRTDLIGTFGLPPALIETVPNGYDIDAINAAGSRAPAITLPPRFIVAVGRLVRAKGFDLLVDAYADATPGPPLLILGEGPEQSALERLIRQRGLERQVQLLGFQDDPFPIVARADFLVSASHNEGFPNALAEAMVLGRPVIATDCPSGPAELLGAPAGELGSAVTAPYGLVVADGDRAGLTAAIRRMAGRDEAERYGRAARQRMNDFRVEVVAELYWRAFDALLTRSAG